MLKTVYKRPLCFRFPECGLYRACLLFVDDVRSWCFPLRWCGNKKKFHIPWGLSTERINTTSSKDNLLTRTQDNELNPTTRKSST